MGKEIVVASAGAPDLSSLIAGLAASGLFVTLAMVDGALVPPRAAPPTAWREVRLRTPSGMVTLARTPTGTAVRVFGNAEGPILDEQARIAAALGAS